MARNDAAGGGWGWLRRRSLVRYAVSLGIPAEEAERIVGAAADEPVSERYSADCAATSREAMTRALDAARRDDVSLARRLAFAALLIIADSLLLAWLFR